MRIKGLLAYLRHRFNAVNEHGIHSPYFFAFYNAVIKRSRAMKADPTIEALRKSLRAKRSPIVIENWGAGSVRSRRRQTLSTIMQTSVSPPRLSLLYRCIIDHIKARHVVELGTSVGLNSLYMAHRATTRVTTFEGNEVLIDIAAKHFAELKKNNIEPIEGDIAATLPAFIEQTAQIDFALIDANHRYAPTLRYFDLLVQKLSTGGVVVVDDIHWSDEMEKAWKTLKDHKSVYGSIDLYRCGLLFFDPALNRQHFVCSL